MTGTGITKTHIQWVFEPVSPYESDAAHDFRLYWPGTAFIEVISYINPQLQAISMSIGCRWMPMKMEALNKVGTNLGKSSTISAFLDFFRIYLIE